MTRRMPVVGLWAIMVIFGWTLTASAQNDWQYPDPYFGTFAFGPDPGPQTHREYREEISPPSARSRGRLVRSRSGRLVRSQAFPARSRYQPRQR